MKKFAFLMLLLVLLMPALVVVAQDEAVVARLEEYNANLPQGYGVVSVEDLLTILAEREVVLLDVREVEEYEAGHVEGSFNVPIRTLGQNLNLLPDLDAEIIIICKGGARALLAMTSLNILGYENARILRGGYDGWVAEELPTTTEAFVPEPGTAPEFEPAVYAAVDNYLSTLPQGYGLVRPADVATELVENPPILIDVRSQEEWDSNGYIEGALHIWINEFMSRRDEWPADKEANIVIYCASGVRGSIATVMMRLMGYSNVRNMSGGMNAWVAAELPVVGVPEAVVEEFSLETYLADYIAALPNTFNAIRVPDLAAELDSGAELLLVDVRTPDEYGEGFIEGAINIPLNELTLHLDMLPNLDQAIVVYCGSGHRSALAMTALNLLGYSNVRSMLSGVNAWTGAGLPLSQEAVEAPVGTAPEFDPAVFEAVDAYMTAIPAGYYTVRAADLSTELIENPPVLIDVRTDSEWAEGHIEGAIHISLRDLFTLRDQWPQDPTTPIVIYDNPTHRSSIAMTVLRMLGYENVRVLAGGVGAWTAAELPLVNE